ncbi:MAG TPA: hypothetical protein VLA91_16190 [Acidimicrobiia bacterium]|nr:hypothetical protein [Acidimicrobiia bacterium]
MKRLLVVAASLLLVAASPDQVVPELEDNGYYIEAGSTASEAVVSDAVFEGRADGGRLYLVVLSEEPAGGAPTFSDSVLDRLGSGYVVTIAPETVGFAGDGTAWGVDEMNAAIDASLDGGSDDQVVELFISELTGAGIVPSPGGEEPADGGGGSGWIWLVVIAGGALLIFSAMRNSWKKRAEMAGSELEKVKAMAKAKLAEVANDIIEMEHEVELSDNAEVKSHYQSASATYAEALARTEKDPGPAEMLDVVRDLDVAIWELDVAEALLDGKPVPEKPKPPEPKPPARQPGPAPTEIPEGSYGRRPERQSSYAGSDLMTALWALLAMSGRGGGGWGGTPGGFGGPMRGGGGGGGRMRGGGMRLGGGIGRIRGGGRRR